MQREDGQGMLTLLWAHPSSWRCPRSLSRSSLLGNLCDKDRDPDKKKKKKKKEKKKKKKKKRKKKLSAFRRGPAGTRSLKKQGFPRKKSFLCQEVPSGGNE